MDDLLLRQPLALTVCQAEDFAWMEPGIKQTSQDKQVNDAEVTQHGHREFAKWRLPVAAAERAFAVWRGVVFFLGDRSRWGRRFDRHG